MNVSKAADTQLFLKGQILHETVTFQEHLHLNSVVTHEPLLSQVLESSLRC